jgi:hypothetical protein
MNKIQIKVPQRFKNKEQELIKFIKQHNPVLLLEKFTGRKLKRNVIVRHKPLKLAADFRDDTIYVDFNNNVKYIWLCVCHELAHIILENPAWHKDKKIKEIIKNQKAVISKWKYTFIQAIEQTLAILLQAACENKAGLRRLEWKEWESTFDCMAIKDFGEKLWKDWLIHLENLSDYKNIDEWILKELKKTKIAKT